MLWGWGVSFLGGKCLLVGEFPQDLLVGGCFLVECCLVGCFLVGCLLGLRLSLSYEGEERRHAFKSICKCRMRLLV